MTFAQWILAFLVATAALATVLVINLLVRPTNPDPPEEG